MVPVSTSRLGSVMDRQESMIINSQCDPTDTRAPFHGFKQENLKSSIYLEKR